MTRVRVKVCGVTSVDDARAAVDAGVDAIGLNCFPQSPRYIEPGLLAGIVEAVHPFVMTVAVFVNASAATVRLVCEASKIDRLQFHGDEPASFCAQFARPYIKAVGVGADFDFTTIEREYDDASAFILDAYAPTERGGTGHAFNWAQWPATRRSLVLAGGLDADNVTRAIETTGAVAVDVASGVEANDDKRRKDHGKLDRFMAAVRRTDAIGRLNQRTWEKRE